MITSGEEKAGTHPLSQNPRKMETATPASLWPQDLSPPRPVPAMQDPFTKTLDLVRQAQGGDRDALERLLHRYYERVRRAVRARLGQRLRNHMESGDILQQTLIKAVEKFNDFEMRHEGSLIHWLAKIAEHQIRDAVDKIKAIKNTPPGPLISVDQPASPDQSGLLGEVIPDPDRGPEADAMESEESRLLQECMDQLPEQYRELIIAWDIEGMPWEEIATTYGRPSASAARNMHAKAKAELSKMVLRRRRAAAE
jgi:RNA polymerase sigma-70 factor (ECF subfamily)